MAPLRVLIAGASIAGPCTAYWLARTGATITIIERYPALRTAGQGIDIRTAGVTVMRRMPGMETAVRAKTTSMDGVSLVDAKGAPYGVLRSTGNPDQQSLVSEYEIFRGDLARILYDMTVGNERIKYVFGEQVASMQQSEKGKDGPITVDFQKGHPRQEYDLVVACDGATSRTRAMGLGCGVRDYVHPTNLWAAYWSVKEDLLEGSTIGHGHSAIGGRVVALGPDPAGGTRVTLMGAYPSSEKDGARPFRDAQKEGEVPLKQYLRKHFEGVGWKAKELMDGLMDADDFYGSEMVQVKAPALSKGRFVMVGDAGYAVGPTGGGTSVALAGAYVLAGEISKHKGDLHAAMEGYERQMRPIITEMQKIPPFVPGFFAPQTAWGLWFRNTIFAFITRTGIVEFMQKYLAGSFASTDAFPLPEYQWAA